MSSARFVLPLVVCFCVAQIATAAAGLSQFQGRFLHLTTDLDSPEEAQRLVDSFDTAVLQWLRFWNLSERDFSNFRVEAFVMKDPSRFRQQGLIPPSVPDFPFGYALGQQIWVHVQPSEYYTRHLTLHEGVHCLAYAAFSGAGPSWFQEGTAELLATHRGAGTDLQAHQIPRNREEVPHWGRFKSMNQMRNEGRTPSLATVMSYQPDLRGDVGTYSWSWAATMLLHAYPDTREAFLSAARNGRIVGPGFNHQLQRTLHEQWPVVLARWRLLCHELDYGFDWTRETVSLSTRDPIWNGRPVDVPIAANRGWQSLGSRLAGGSRLRIEPSGEVILAQTERAWVSKPTGITYQYHRGRPLGQLLVCVLPNAVDAEAKTIAPLTIHSLAQDTELEITEYSWLLFRVNDDVGQLDDNQGQFEVRVSRIGSR